MISAPKRTAILGRISDDRDGESAGVGRQLADDRKLAAARGWQVGPDETHVITEDSVSAYKRRAVCRGCYLPARRCTCPPLPNGARRPTVLRTWRPEFRRLVAMIASGECDAVIAYDLDRTCRDPRDLEDLIDAVESRNPRPPVESVTGSLRLATDADIAMARVMVAMANKSSRDTARRVARKREDKAKAGEFGGGLRGYGYALEPTGQFRKDGTAILAPVIVAAEANEIRRWARQVIAGVSLSAIAEDLRTRGVPTARGAAWQASTVRDVLLSPRVAGLSTYQGEPAGVAGWEPVLDRDTWDAVTTILANPARKTTTGNVPCHLLSLIARCGTCGGPVTAKDARGTLAYACRDGHMRRKITPVDDYVTDVIIARLAQPDARDLIAPAGTGPGREALGAELAGLRARRAEVLALVSDGTYTAGEAREAAAPLAARITELERQMASRATVSPLALLPLGSDEAAVRKRWAELPLGVKREVIRTLVTVTLARAKTRYPGGAYFSEDSVIIEWR